MIPRKTLFNLMENWGDKAESMSCFTEIKFFDDLMKVDYYVYALDPSDADTIKLIIRYANDDIDVCEWRLSELLSTYNKYGEYPRIDREFRRIRTSELFKKLNIKGNV